jgi:hypothetical protein
VAPLNAAPASSYRSVKDAMPDRWGRQAISAMTVQRAESAGYLYYARIGASAHWVSPPILIRYAPGVAPPPIAIQSRTGQLVRRYLQKASG